MENNEIRKEGIVYLDDSRTTTFKHSLVIQTTNQLTIINFDNDTILTKNGKIVGTYYYYNFFIVCDNNNNLKGVIRRDGLIVVPFNFYDIRIEPNDMVSVKRTRIDSFEEYCKLPYFD